MRYLDINKIEEKHVPTRKAPTWDWQQAHKGKSPQKLSSSAVAIIATQKFLYTKQP